jgi:hypothetical protein
LKPTESTPQPPTQQKAEAEVAFEQPFLWLDEDENEAVAECGCRLVRDMGSSGGCPAVFLCAMHKAGAGMYARLEDDLKVAEAWKADAEEEYHWGEEGPRRGLYMPYDAACRQVGAIQDALAEARGGR